MPRMVNIDRATPMLLPVDLRDWVPDDDMVHFVIEAIDKMSLPSLHVNRRGTGSAQYPPRMMLALLVYCYANGIFSSRRIEQATYRDVCVRFLTADTHPDHDTICSFRRKNLEVISEAFLELLQLARQMGVLKVGTISVDGTQIRANASKDKNVRYDRAVELEAELKEDIADLLKKAEEADSSDGDDGQRLPEAIARRERLLAKIESAREQLEAQAKARFEHEQAEYEKKLAAREGRQERRGRVPKPPEEKPPPADKQKNLTDGDSCLMRKNKHDGTQQRYNAQAAVDADGSMLVLGAHVATGPSDANELLPALASVDDSLGKVTAVLADAGYLNTEVLEQLEDSPVDAYVATGREGHTQRTYDYRPKSVVEKPERRLTDPRLLAMRDKLKSDVGRALYERRNRTVEPVFGIIKSAMKFDQFHLRGATEGQRRMDTGDTRVQLQEVAPRQSDASVVVRGPRAHGATFRRHNNRSDRARQQASRQIDTHANLSRIAAHPFHTRLGEHKVRQAPRHFGWIDQLCRI